MNGRSKVWVLDWLLPLGFGLALLLVASLRTGLEFGADEGYELMKRWLVSLGHLLYLEIWNDQPPWHTELSCPPALPCMKTILASAWGFCLSSRPLKMTRTIPGVEP